MSRSTVPLQALGGVQTVALGAIYLALALAAIFAIGWFASVASRENASALHLERSVAQLQVLLRGLNEMVVTQGSLASRNIARQASAEFQRLRGGLAERDDAALLAGWDAVHPRIKAFIENNSNVSFGDDALITLGRITSEIEKVVAGATGGAEAQRAQAAAAERRARIVVLGAATVILLGTLAIFMAFHRNVTHPVESAIGFARRVAQGDLSMRGGGERGGQAGRLLHSLEHMRDSLATIVSGVRDGTAAIDRSARRLAENNVDLSQRTQRQATALEETAASMEELTTVVAGTAENSRLASVQAAEARAVAARGGEVVGSFLGKMESIRDGSRRVAEIIGVIDSIAFQTNILALNAAVEAARAGEQGRGFAVVASEVRALSQRTATAAREIKELIRGSSEQIAEGATMVSASREIMDRIEAGIGEVARLVEAISVASKQQSAGLQQVSSAVVQLEQTVQENAALVERISTSSEGLKDHAGSLLEAVHVFRLDEGPGPASEPAPGPAPSAAPIAAAAALPAKRAGTAPARRAAKAHGEPGDGWEEF